MISEQKKLNMRKARRVARVRSRIVGTKEKPRLAVFRSNRYFYAQLIDDENGKTLVAASSMEEKRGAKKEKAARVGELIARRAKEVGITKTVFDRRSYRYHGRVRAFAEGARKEGLIF